MTGDGRKRGGMWSFDVKLSRAPDMQLLMRPPACNFEVAGVELCGRRRCFVWAFASSNTNLFLSAIDTFDIIVPSKSHLNNVRMYTWSPTLSNSCTKS
jgi:hypothetical protein